MYKFQSLDFFLFFAVRLNIIIIIFPKMNVMTFENLYSYRMLMFLFKNRDLFNLNKSVWDVQMGTLLSFRTMQRVHSRNQAKYLGYHLTSELKSELKLSTFTRRIRLLFELFMNQ